MTVQDLSAKLELHPRACIIEGVIIDRQKNTKALPFSGLQPHYAMMGVPLVRWNGDEPAEILLNGAEIEFSIEESDHTYRLLAGRYNSTRTFVQAMFGNKAVPPTANALKALREASGILTKAHAERRKVAVAGCFVTTISGGNIDGRLYPLAVADATTGDLLWLNPEGVTMGWVKADFPAHQVVRSLTEVSAPQAVDWYATYAEALEGLVEPSKMHATILHRRANALLKSGAVTTIEAGLAQASEEAPEPPKPAAKTVSKAAPAPKPAATVRATPRKR